MERNIGNRKMTPVELAWVCGTAALLFAFFCSLAVIGGSWILWVKYSQVTVSMEIEGFDDWFFELRIKDGSHNTRWVECSPSTISMEIDVFNGWFFELRIKNGSHNTKEEMDT